MSVETVKETFVWEDMFNKDNIIPCVYCTAINEFPLCNFHCAMMGQLLLPVIIVNTTSIVTLILK